MKPNDRWTKEEMRLHKHGYLDLIAAVIKQWAKDGKPRASAETVQLWYNLMLQCKDK